MGPQKSVTQASPLSADRPDPAAGKIRDIILLAAGMVLITYLHYFPLHLEFISHGTFHILLRRLYYLPILYAALRFGLRGGLITSVSATLLFVPHAAITLGGFTSPSSVDNLFDLILYNVVGLTTGLVVDSRRRQATRYQEVVNLNQEIEDRETAIRHMQAQTESILSSVSSGVISCDRRGMAVTANPAARRLLARPVEEIVSWPLDRIFPENTELLRAVRLILSGEQERSALEMELPAEGGPRTVAVRITPHIGQHRTQGAVITLEDLTEVKDLTEQLMRADRLSGLGELVAGVAHEVRNPLGVIRASVQMLEQEMVEGCSSAELTQVMIQEIDRLDSLVNALLDFGRPSRSQFGAVHARQVLDEVILLTRQFARQQSVDVEARYPDDLPAIWADPDRLKQVFVNLISNAIQAMPEGGRLTVSAAAREGYLRIEFIDSGIGIDAGEQDRIFNPFHTTRAEGSGLGLAIVHRIVDAHNGFITVESQPGSGSTFTVGIPLAGTAGGGRDASAAGESPAPAAASPEPATRHIQEQKDA